MNKVKDLKKPFIILCVIYLIGISAIIRANVNYLDDIGRVYLGYSEWDNYSRYLSNFFSHVIHADKYLTDVSPFTQVLAAIMISFASTILLKLFCGDNITWKNICAVLPVGLSPYFLTCFSYKYDAPYMALSVLASVVPFLFVESGVIVYVISTVAGILVMCMTYQAASGIYPIIVIVYCTKLWNKGYKTTDVLKKLFISTGAYAFGILFFKFFLMKKADWYASNSIISWKYLPFGIWRNLLHYYRNVFDDFKTVWIVLILIIMISYAVLSIAKSSRNKLMSCIVNIISLIVTLGLTFGMYPALQNALFETRAMYGFGVFIALIAVVCSSYYEGIVLNLAPIILSWCFLVFGFTYGNALYAEKEYTDFRIFMILDDLNELDLMNSDNEMYVALKGSISYSPVVNNMPDDCNILKRMLQTPLENSTWNEDYMLNYFGITKLHRTDDVELYNMDLPLLKESMYQNIYADDTYMVIELK